LKLRNGKLAAVSPKSGHYKPAATEVCNLLTWMTTNNIDLIGAKVQWFAMDNAGTLLLKQNMQKIEWYDARAYLAAAGIVTGLAPLRHEFADKNGISNKLVYDRSIGNDPNDLNNYKVPPRDYDDWLN
jgi:hypothetical protein